MAIIDNKVYWNNKIGVIISPRGDRGFYTRGASKECIMDATLAQLIHEKKFIEARKYVEDTYPGTPGENMEDLDVVWVHIGSEFTVVEVDGRERILYKPRVNWLTAD
jgi:hypothetical protein